MSQQSNVTYRVHSLHVRESGQAEEVVETRRTDTKVAADDVILIRGVLHRKAWVEEVEK